MFNTEQDFMLFLDKNVKEKLEEILCILNLLDYSGAFNIFDYDSYYSVRYFYESKDKMIQIIIRFMIENNVLKSLKITDSRYKFKLTSEGTNISYEEILERLKSFL